MGTPYVPAEERRKATNKQQQTIYVTCKREHKE